MKRKNGSIRPFVRQFYRGNGLCIFLAVILSVLMAGLNLALSWILQQTLDLIAGDPRATSFPELLALAGASTLLLVLAFGLAYWSRPRFLSRAMAQYKEYVFRQLSKKGISAFYGENTALYISALSNDAATIENKYLSQIFQVIDMVLVCIGALVMMFCYNPLLTFIALGLSLLPVGASVLTGDKVAVAEKRVSDANEDYMASLRDSLAGFSVIKSFKAEAQMCRLFARKVRTTAKAKERSDKLGVIIEMLSTLAYVIVQFGVFLVGAWLALSGSSVTPGVVLVFVQLLNYVLRPISSIPNFIAGRKTAMELIRKLAGALEENVRSDGKMEQKMLNQGIRLEDLTFGYGEGEPTLKGLNFTFEAGKSYAIVGASGSGKSTILNLLTGAYGGYTGRILYDDLELRDISGESLYDLVSLIQQNVFIFNASIRDNITMFTEFPAEEVNRAIDLSGLAALIQKRGEEYLCGENGSGLSGGEKQRISIARSLMKKSRVLLVDEATAALDPGTARQVASAILDLTDTIRIVVTHSLEERILRRYDCILAVKNGQIADAGTFEDLMERKGYFYSLYTVSH